MLYTPLDAPPSIKINYNKTKSITVVDGLPTNINTFALTEIICRDLNQIHSVKNKLKRGEEDLNSQIKSEIQECMTYWLAQSLPYQLENIDINTEVLHWDRAFRLSPQPPAVLTEMKALDHILPHLKADWVNLPLNYAKDLDELKNSDYGLLPENILAELQSNYHTLSKIQKLSLDLLWQYFHQFSFAFCLFYLKGKISQTDFLRAYFAFAFSEDIEQLDEKGMLSFDYLSNRLINLESFLKVLPADS